jgi:hypothetical protein
MHTPIDACTNASIHARNDEDVRVSTEHNPDHEIIYIKTGAVCDRFAVLLMPAEAQQCEGCIRCNGCCAGGRRGRRPVGVNGVTGVAEREGRGFSKGTDGRNSVRSIEGKGVVPGILVYNCASPVNLGVRFS